jgi:putative acetyltransferase
VKERPASSSSLRIRPFRSDDAPALARVIGDAIAASDPADYGMQHLEPLIEFFTPEAIERANASRLCLVAEENGEVVGTGGLQEGELVTFFVTPARQRSGVGSALLSAVEEIARKQGLSRLRVGASLAGVAFYERHGYVRTGEALPGTAGPHVAMGKKLEARS